ncbi:Hypothetical predicted protein, partial [Pelobates cultripes]
PIAKPQRVLTTHLLTAANLLIPIHWKASKAPSVREWLQKVESIRIMEELTASMNDKYAHYASAWEPWSKYIDNTTTS